MRPTTLLNDILSTHGKEISRLYTSGKTIKEVAYYLNIAPHMVRTALLKQNITLRRFKDYRWIPTSEDITYIKKMYVDEKRGIQYIARHFKTDWKRIEKILKNNGISKWSQKEITTSNSQIYGPTRGFLGRRHTIKTRQKMSASQLNNKNRLSTTGPKSRYIATTIGKVQGSYEVAYLQQHFDASGSLPSIGTAVHTPYGSYIPDFDCGNVFVEVKSPFTWRVCRGLEPNQKGIKSAIQYKKIKWVDKNVKPVIISVFENEDAMNLFKKAIVNKQIVTDDIIYKNGKYSKLENPVLHDGL